VTRRLQSPHHWGELNHLCVCVCVCITFFTSGQREWSVGLIEEPNCSPRLNTSSDREKRAHTGVAGRAWKPKRHFLCSVLTWLRSKNTERPPHGFHVLVNASRPVHYPPTEMSHSGRTVSLLVVLCISVVYYCSHFIAFDHFFNGAAIETRLFLAAAGLTDRSVVCLCLCVQLQLVTPEPHPRERWRGIRCSASDEEDMRLLAVF